MTRVTPSVVLAGTVLLFLGCQRPASSAAEGGPAPSPPREAPTLEELRNTAYGGLEVPGGTVTLADGEWEGEPYEEGAASRPRVSLVRDLRVVGDLDGDGADEAVVALAESSGGTGTLVHLAVVARTDEGLENVATTLLGDRVQLRGMRIEEGRLLVDVLRAGPDDPACCPGDLATLGYTLAAGDLEPFDPETPGARLSLETLGEAEWVLRSWAWDEPAPAEPEVTLQYLEGRFAGRSGCNRYFAPVKETGQTPGAIEVGPAAGTRMACPDPAGAIETRFLQQLEGVNAMGFRAGQLMLSYTSDESRGVMLFDSRSTPGSRGR
jgi:heat shock protein HslJ